MNIDQDYNPGDIVYIIVRNPHAQNVANVQQAAIVQHPEKDNELALFVHDEYYPLSEEFAIFETEEQAEMAYNESFNTMESEYNG